jgi:acyl-CoA thioesterase-1
MAPPKTIAFMLRSIALLAFACICFGQPNPALREVPDVPGLPRVLLIGDSISIGYTEPVRAELTNKANLHRIPENGAATIVGVKNLENWLSSSKWDVIHFNFGLHDLR